MRTKALSFLALFAFLLAASPAEAQRRPAKPRAAKATTAAKAQVRVNRGARQEVAPGANLAKQALRPSAKAQSAFQAALKSSSSKFFTRDVNGSKRFIANVTGQDALNKISAAMGKNSNVIQILHFGQKGLQHTLAIFDGELVHTQFAGGTGNWRLRTWGDTLRASNTKMFSAFIALSPTEAQQLRINIKQGRKDQGPDHLAGPNWANGKLKNTSMGGCRGFNCASVWTEMPLGAKGETLGHIAGIGHQASGNPRMLQKLLETGGNERIVGIAVYGPRVENFGGNPATPVVDL